MPELTADRNAKSHAFRSLQENIRGGKNAVGKKLKQLPSHLRIFMWELRRCKPRDELANGNQFHCLISVGPADIPRVFEKRGSIAMCLRWKCSVIGHGAV